MQDNQREAVLLAYLAGIVDGEGTIGFVKVRNTLHPSFGIGMSNYEIVEMFHQKYRPAKKIQIERVPNRKVIYRFRLMGRHSVQPLLRELLPYLRIKKSQAELVLQYCNRHNYDWKKKQVIICVECKRERPRRSWGRCNTCYLKMRKRGEKPNMPKMKMCLPISEIQWREELYQKVKKLNAVGAPATTK